MTRFVIDAATLLQLVASGTEVAPRHQVVAPNGIRSHALSLLLEAVRRGDLTEDQALRHHELLTELKTRLLGDRVSRRTAWKIASQQGWDTMADELRISGSGRSRTGGQEVGGVPSDQAVGERQHLVGLERGPDRRHYVRSVADS